MTTIADINDQVVALNIRMTEVAALLGDAAGKVMAIAQQAVEQTIELRRALGEALEIAADGWAAAYGGEDFVEHPGKEHIAELRKLVEENP